MISLEPLDIQPDSRASVASVLPTRLARWFMCTVVALNVAIFGYSSWRISSAMCAELEASIGLGTRDIAIRLMGGR
jgi:hypothetical protein